MADKLSLAGDEAAEAAFRLGQASDLPAFLAYLSSHGFSAERLLRLLTRLYGSGCDGAAFLLADMLIRQGIDHPVALLVRHHMGGLLGREAPEAAEDAFARTWNGLGREGQEQLSSLMSFRFGEQVLKAHRLGEVEGVLAGLPFMEIALPWLRGLFAPPAPRIEERIQPPEIPAGPDPPDFPGPEGRAPVSRRCLVAFRERYVLEDPRSRPMELGWRNVAAMKDYGWSASHMIFRNIRDTEAVRADLRQMAQRCREEEIDVLLMEAPLADGLTTDEVMEWAGSIRAERPDFRLAVYCGDPWIDRFARATLLFAPAADRIWSINPTAPLWRRPEFDGKTIHAPNPSPEPRPQAAPSVLKNPVFVGSIVESNWPRALWVAGLRRADIQLGHMEGTHWDDGLDPLPSYRLHLEELGATGVCISLSMRFQGTCSAIGRTFEVPWSGALMLHEGAEDLDHFFTDGRHYLRFTTLADLIRRIEDIRRWPDWAEEIRRNGQAFARERYSGVRIIAHLDRALYGP